MYSELDGLIITSIHDLNPHKSPSHTTNYICVDSIKWGANLAAKLLISDTFGANIGISF